jgi:hypothetical protein
MLDSINVLLHFIVLYITFYDQVEGLKAENDLNVLLYSIQCTTKFDIHSGLTSVGKNLKMHFCL